MSVLFRSLFLCVALGQAHAAAAEPLVRAMVVVEPGTPASVALAAARLEAAGARMPHRFSDGVLVGQIPPRLLGGLPDIPGLTLSVELAGQPGAPAAMPARAPASARAARRFLAGMPVVDLPEPTPLGGDLVEPLEWEIAEGPKALSSSGCSRPAATSAYLVGSVAIGILLPESTGAENTEDWSTPDPRRPADDRQDLVVAEILEGCDTLVAQIPIANLSFAYEVRRAIPIAHEPILHAVGARDIWIRDILEAIGHGAASEAYGVGGYARALRDRLDTDWAAVAFIADDLNDADNGFPPTGFPFAYALLGGPYMVMTYDNDGWGISRMDVVFRHELGHVFRALDEYRSAGNSCSNISGYLSVANANNDSPPGDPACLSATTCVMRANTTPIACEYSLGQMGVRDLDGDGIPDVRDNPPDSHFELAGPLLIETDAVTIRARSTAKARPEESPHAPATFSVNRVALAEMSLNGGAWSPLTPDDGGYGDRCEDFTIDLTGLAEGWHEVRVRALNDVDILEPSPATLRIYVNTDCADDASEPLDDTPAGAVPRPVGAHDLVHCAFDQDWSRFYLLAGASVGVTVTQADPTGSLDVRLEDEGGAVLARASASGGVATLAAVAPRSATYLLVVEDDAEFETAYRLDLVADCLDDPEEPDSPAPLGVETVPGLLRQRVLCAGDDDRYLLSVQAGSALSADMAFDGALGDLDVEILDPSGAPVASSTGTGSTESAAFVSVADGVHVVRVFGKSATDRNVYDLTLGATGCVDDRGENDDSAATARPLVAGQSVSGTICGADEDWLTFTTAGRRLVRVQLAHDPAGNLDLELRDATGARLIARSLNPGAAEDITTERLMPGAYAVRVLGTGSGRVAYRLTLEDEDPLLLFVRKDPTDALLRWNLSNQECFTLRRHEHPARRTLTAADLASPRLTLIQEGDPTVPDGDRPIEDLGYRDRDVITDGMFLYTYLVDPHDCGVSLVNSTKTADPYPVAVPGPGTRTVPIVYTITLANSGVQDAFGVTVTDDVPRACQTFTVDAIPPGATDASAPPPAGANGRGLITVAGITVPSLAERTVIFTCQAVPFSAGGDSPMVDNQGTITVGTSPVGPGTTYRTDDPATGVFPDDTRVYMATFTQEMLISAFWHAQVDFDVRVTDPCGNVLGPGDLATAMCGGRPGNVRYTDSCAARSFPGRFEQVVFGGFPPSPGDYLVEIVHRAESPGDAACRGQGPDEVTVILQLETGATTWRTLTVPPGQTVPAMTFTR